MILFVDQPRQIRLIRTTAENGVTTRAPIGRVMKNNFEIAPELASSLSSDEAHEVEQALATYKQTEKLRKQYHALSLPMILREAMDYFEETASEGERHLMVGALMEAVRRMRKFGRVAAPD